MRWLDKARELKDVMPDDEDAKLAFSKFLHAADIRTAAHRSPRRRELLNDAAKAHREGVKAYHKALEK